MVSRTTFSTRAIHKLKLLAFASCFSFFSLLRPTLVIQTKYKMFLCFMDVWIALLLVKFCVQLCQFGRSLVI